VELEGRRIAVLPNHVDVGDPMDEDIDLDDEDAIEEVIAGRQNGTDLYE
jgi:hypothetical protein